MRGSLSAAAWSGNCHTFSFSDPPPRTIHSRLLKQSRAELPCIGNKLQTFRYRTRYIEFQISRLFQWLAAHLMN